MKQAVKHIVIFVATLAFIIFSLFLVSKADNSNQMKRLGYGLPFNFVYQDLSEYDDSFTFFPRYQKFEFARNKIIEFSLSKLALDILIVFISLEIILIFIIETIYFKLKRKTEEE